MSWSEDAACRGMDIGWWYPTRGDRLASAVARMICRSCPVRGECLAAALAEEAEVAWRYGVRGGLTAGERSSLARAERQTGVAL